MATIIAWATVLLGLSVTIYCRSYYKNLRSHADALIDIAASRPVTQVCKHMGGWDKGIILYMGNMVVTLEERQAILTFTGGKVFLSKRQSIRLYEVGMTRLAEVAACEARDVLTYNYSTHMFSPLEPWDPPRLAIMKTTPSLEEK